MTTKDLITLSHLTGGRIAPRTVFADFVALCALYISNTLDFVHYEERSNAYGKILANYTETEQQQLSAGLQALVAAVQKDMETGQWDDRLGAAFQELGMSGKNGVVFTPPHIGRLMAQLTLDAAPELPPAGYFTLTDPACGSGVLLLASAEHIANAGFNLCRHLAVQAVDLNITCAQMAYVNLSLFGIPAVVIHGNTITQEEFSRWYTPAYLLENWVWRCPLPFGGKRSQSDELLKMATDPIYAALRSDHGPELDKAM